MKKRCECGFKVKVTCKLIHWEPGNGTEGSCKQVVPQVIPNPYLRGSIIEQKQMKENRRNGAQLSTYSTKAVHQTQLDIRALSYVQYMTDTHKCS